MEKTFFQNFPSKQLNVTPTGQKKRNLNFLIGVDTELCVVEISKKEFFLGDKLELLVKLRDSNRNPSVGENLFFLGIVDPKDKAIDEKNIK
jgi:hypothetical protein